MFVFCRVSTGEVEWLFEIFRRQTEGTEKFNFREIPSKWRLRRYQVPFCSKNISPCSYPPIVEINMNDMVFHLTKTVGGEKWNVIDRCKKYKKKWVKKNIRICSDLWQAEMAGFQTFPGLDPLVAFLKCISATKSNHSRRWIFEDLLEGNSSWWEEVPEYSRADTSW